MTRTETIWIARCIQNMIEEGSQPTSMTKDDFIEEIWARSEGHMSEIAREALCSKLDS